MASTAFRRKHDDSDDEGNENDPELEAEMNRIMGRTGVQKRPEPKLSLLERAQLAQQRRMVGGGGAALSAHAPRVSARPSAGVAAALETRASIAPPTATTTTTTSTSTTTKPVVTSSPSPAMNKRHVKKSKGDKKGNESESESEEDDEDEDEPDEKAKERLKYLATLSHTQKVLQSEVTPPMKTRGAHPPAKADDVPAPPPMDDIPAPPPMDDDIPVAPPMDDDIPLPPPMDDDDDDIPIAPPVDAEDDIPAAPPMDDDIIVSASTSGPTNCEFCEEVHLATHRCVECEQNTCDLLGKIHLKARATANHHIVPLNQSNAPLCKAHSIPVSLMCHQEQTAICATCATTTHKSHKHENLKDFLTNKRASLTSMVEKAELLIKKWSLAAENAKVTKEELKNGEILLEIKIHAVFDKLQRALQDRHEAILSEAALITKAKTNLVDSRSATIQSQLGPLAQIKNEVKDSLSESKSPNYFDLEKKLADAIDATQHLPVIDNKVTMLHFDEQAFTHLLSHVRLQQVTVSGTAAPAKPSVPSTTSSTTATPTHVAVSPKPEASPTPPTPVPTTATTATTTTTTTTPVKTLPVVAATPKAEAPATSIDTGDVPGVLNWSQLCSSKCDELSIAMPFADTKEGAGVATGTTSGRFWAYYTHDLQKNGNSRLWMADLKSGATQAINLPFNIENTYPLYDGKEYIYLFEDARYGFGRVNVNTLAFEALDDTRHPVEPQCSACFQDGQIWRIQNRSLVSYDPKTRKWSSVHAILNNKMIMFADPYRTDRIWMINNKGDFLSFDTKKSSLTRVSTTRYEQIVDGTFAAVLFPLEEKEIAIATQWGNGPWQLHNLSSKVWVDLDWPKVQDGGHIGYNPHRKEVIFQVEGKKTLHRVSL